MKRYALAVVLLTILSNTSNAQGFLNRLKQKAQQVGERVIDKAVDNVINKKPAEVKESQPQETQNKATPPIIASADSVYKNTASVKPMSNMILTDTLVNGPDTVYHFNTATINRKDFISYALTLKGTPYVYGSTDPAYGLDCSGFITHVFNHFNIQVPRRTYDFKNAEKKISIQDAQPGDIILFTGFDATKKVPGHMGIITAKGKDIQFVHAASGSAGAVTTAMLSYSYFKSRFLEIVRVF